MHKDLHLHNLKNILKQRNLFLTISLGLLLGNIFLSLNILLQSEKVILIPGLREKAWLSRNTVSNSYLEEMTNIYLNHLLDINAKNIPYKKSLIISNVSNKNPDYIRAISEYFAHSEDKYKKFDLTTYFTTKKISIDIENLSTIATGILTSSYGRKGVSVNEEKYHLTFDYHNGTLRLKTFTRVKGAAQ